MRYFSCGSYLFLIHVTILVVNDKVVLSEQSISENLEHVRCKLKQRRCTIYFLYFDSIVYRADRVARKLDASAKGRLH